MVNHCSDTLRRIPTDSRAFIARFLIPSLDLSVFCVLCVRRDRMSASDALQHCWLTAGQLRAKATVLSKEKLKKFIIRRKWQVRSHAIWLVCCS